MRILITGSRDWPDPDLIITALTEYEMSTSVTPTLVSGNCPTGADAFAEAYASVLGWKIERHPADWNRYGRRAGFLRNKEMVDLGADVCLSFIKNNSKGASMTTKFAEEAGIPTRIFRMDR